MNAYIYQTELWCETCADTIRANLTDEGVAPDEFPEGPLAEGGGESDAPVHCTGCGVYLSAPLTSVGIEYIIEALRAAGMRTDTLDEWAANVRDYELDAQQVRVVESYLSRRGTLCSR